MWVQVSAQDTPAGLYCQVKSEKINVLCSAVSVQGALQACYHAAVVCFCQPVTEAQPALKTPKQQFSAGGFVAASGDATRGHTCGFSTFLPQRQGKTSRNNLKYLDSACAGVYHAAMAERRQNSGWAGSQSQTRAWGYEPPRRKRGYLFVTACVVAAVVAAVVVADDEWEWRDTLRRILQGEEVPAFRSKEWSNAQSVRESLADNLLTSGLTPTVEERDMRRDLALHTLILAAGEPVISQGGTEMGVLMEELCLDVDWLEEMVYFCPMEYAESALPILAHLYRTGKKRMEGMPCNRRFASAVAFEFARAGLDKQAAQSAYNFYAASGQKHGLNSRFAELAIWEMRVIAARCTDSKWSSETTLNWFQRNCRLPAQWYAKVGNALGGRERSLFGEQVDSPAFLALYGDASAGGAASMYEASGCSTVIDRAYYSATAACANGVPALVASHAGDAVCLVDVNGSWSASSPVADGMTCSWSFCGKNHPDFVELAAVLGSEKEQTLAGARLAHMGRFLYDAGNRPLSHSFYMEALKAQPLNYAAWVDFHAAGATAAEMAEAAKHFTKLPAVGAALSALEAK